MTGDVNSVARPRLTITVTVAFSPAPRNVQEIMLELPAGSTVAAAVKASGLFGNGPDISIAGSSGGGSDADSDAVALGIWGRKAAPDQALRNFDRVEIYRPLKVDPKTARRERFTKQGPKKKAGLFAQRRAGAKPGY